ncbi:MAG: hypothetical protein JSW10_11940 [Pseudomonadota bacterium]|nr:MAG: hypothetical protein JSW10_11940 [Pseudomonadota bacterium]
MKVMRQSLILLTIAVGLAGFSTSVLTANLPAAKPDKGLVVFYRMSRAKGAAIRFEINDAARGSIGLLSNGTILHQDLEPGNHTFTVRSPSVDGQDSITLNAEAGQTYYVKGEILWGWPAGRPKFSRMPESDALADLKRLQ